jgi:putative membrane protein
VNQNVYGGANSATDVSATANMNAGAGSSSSYSASGISAQSNLLLNGYQGPLNFSDFSTYSTAQSFLPAAAESGMREVELSKIAAQKATSPEVRAFAAMMVEEHTRNNQQLMSVASGENVTLNTPAFASSNTGTSTYGSSVSANTMSAPTSNGVGTDSVSSGMGVSSATTYSATGSSAMDSAANSGMTTVADHTAAGSLSLNSSMANGSGNATSNEIAALNNLTGQQFDQQYMRMMLQDHHQAVALFSSAAQSSDAEVKAYAKKTLPKLQAHMEHAKMINRSIF